MTQLLSGIQWLSTELTTAAGVTVEYQRDDQKVDGTLKAIPASQRRSQMNNQGHSNNHQTKDFLFKKADLVIGGNEIEPKRGDVIVETDAAGRVHTFEVMPDKGDPEHVPHDQLHQMIRVHTKRTKVVLP